jgi:hypothetical protein
MFDGPSIMDDRKASDLRYELRYVPRTPLDRVKDDVLVKVRGVVTPEGPLIDTPVTRTPCVAWILVGVTLHPPRTEYDAFGVPVGPYYDLWPSTPLPDETDGRDFFIDDGTSRAKVRVSGAQLSLLGTPATVFAADHPGFLAGRATNPVEPRAELEYVEQLVVPGEILTLYGRVRSEPESHAPKSPHGPESGVPAGKVFSGTSTSPLFIIQERVRSLDAIGG